MLVYYVPYHGKYDLIERCLVRYLLLDTDLTV